MKKKTRINSSRSQVGCRSNRRNHLTTVVFYFLKRTFNPGQPAFGGIQNKS